MEFKKHIDIHTPGDSGGPFTCNGYLVGVTSHGFECGRANYPGIYMDVAYYRNWIESNGSSSSSEGSSLFSTVKKYLYSMSLVFSMLKN
jgi:secreted trypsin-like serine protease